MNDLGKGHESIPLTCFTDNSNPLPAIAVDFRNKILDLAKNAKEGNEQKKDIKVKKNFPRAKNSEDMLAVNAKEMGRLELYLI